MLHQGKPQTESTIYHRSILKLKLKSLQQYKICARAPLMQNNMKMILKVTRSNDVVGLYAIYKEEVEWYILNEI